MPLFTRHFGAVALSFGMLLIPAKTFAVEDAVADNTTVLARGPVHEAFAQPANRAPEAGPVIPKKPPEPVPEEPPDQKPEGDNVQWIPGYWGWNDDSQNFLWVSGTWRATPPERKWVPGYWTQVADGWQWVPGFWAPEQQESLSYQAAPPASLDEGPSTPAPDESSTYIPGSWQYRTSRYAWQPGYWTAAQPGYVWSPSQYCYTPSGYVYAPGYWDYPLESRGCLFAPVVFDRPYWNDPSWCYRPSYCVNPLGLLASLFVRPAWGSYYFGDYYGPRYGRLGFSPWLAYGPRYRDPLFGYYGRANRDNPGWYRGLRDTYRGRLDGTVPLPARTLAGQNALLANASRNGNIGRNINSLNVVRPMSQINNLHLSRLNYTQVAGFRAGAQNIRNLGTARQGFERSGVSRIGKGSSLPLGKGTASKVAATRLSGAGRPTSSAGKFNRSSGLTAAPRPKLGNASLGQGTRRPTGGSRPSSAFNGAASVKSSPRAYSAYQASARPNSAPRARPASSATARSYSAPRARPASSATARSYSAPRARPSSSATARSYSAPRARPSSPAPARSYSAPRARPSAPAAPARSYSAPRARPASPAPARSAPRPSPSSSHAPARPSGGHRH